jgi:hypothetical protein
MTPLPDNCNHNAPQPGSTGFRAAKAICRDRGVSDTTLWRWGKRGWIKIINICGKSYVDLRSLAEFDRRAVAGEFAKRPHGAAGTSARERAAREGTEMNIKESF